MQVYTYYTKETELPSTKLSTKNVREVFNGDGFTIKIKPAIVGYHAYEESAYVYTRCVFIYNVDGHIRADNKRLFKLLEPFDITIEEPTIEGKCEYLHFRRGPNNTYRCHLVTFVDDDEDDE